MNKKIVIGVIVLFVLIMSLFFAFPKLNEKYIKLKIEKANYCSVDSDCIDAGGKCPFDCYVYVNKNEANKITELIESFDSKCIYNCISCQTAICENNKCKAVCE